MTSNGNQPRLRVAVDAMGGDSGPSVTVPGALMAMRAHPNLHVTLVGDADAVRAELGLHDVRGLSVEFAPSEGKVTDDEHPISALRQKPRSSISVATQLLRSGDADMVVSVGSTGASMATAALGLGLMEGLARPCIGGNFLGLAPNTTVVDLGSNVDCRPSLLLSFAALGVAFSRSLLNIANPRVGLLSVGEEAAKGNRQVQETHTLFSESPLNFVGNVEGMDFFTDRADVIVCDGFVGNILIKFAEGLGSVLRPYLSQQLAAVLPSDQLSRVADALWDTTNRPRTMGGPLFGVNGLVMVGHGSSAPEGIAGAIDTGILCHQINLVDGFRQELSELHRAGVLDS
jgi:glycerol-3-phosphate acyltransferase PlsX